MKGKNYEFALSILFLGGELPLINPKCRLCLHFTPIIMVPNYTLIALKNAGFSDK